MPKLRKLRMKQKFQYGANRKRIRNRQEKSTKFNVKVDCPVLKASWNNRKSLKENMTELGVAFDANQSVAKINNQKRYRKKFNIPEEPKVEEEETKGDGSSLAEKVVAELESTAAAAVKPPTFRFSTDQVKWISDMMDRHKYNYKAMARDPKNHFQETPNQIKHKIRKFMSIPDHFVPYCRERGLLNASVDESAAEMDTA